MHSFSSNIIVVFITTKSTTVKANFYFPSRDCLEHTVHLIDNDDGGGGVAANNNKTNNNTINNNNNNNNIECRRTFKKLTQRQYLYFP